MADWIDELAATFGQLPLSPQESDLLLRTAREVAHRTERKVTPLAAFLVGLEVAGHMTAGQTREEAIGRAVASVDDLLPAPEGG